ncbi:MAG: hypothetical protein EU539_11260 [Promethearchaeota archaeon]|nr:MAG: hypothetical protein EU539_11260 [Candidatus Lokiarchaeota archaeon]
MKELKSDIRVNGIDKRLVLIQPNSQGHDELSIINNEAVVAKIVGISIDTIMERKKVLLKREKLGKTGTYLKREIGIDETVEEVLKNLADKKRIIRNKLNLR